MNKRRITTVASAGSTVVLSASPSHRPGGSDRVADGMFRIAQPDARQTA